MFARYEMTIREWMLGEGHSRLLYPSSIILNKSTKIAKAPMLNNNVIAAATLIRLSREWVIEGRTVGMEGGEDGE
jgi:hypothetical protein